MEFEKALYFLDYDLKRFYDNDFIDKCVKEYNESKADNVEDKK